MGNDDATVGRILTRREAIAAGFVFAAGGMLARAVRGADVVSETAKLVASPAVTEGPFFVDERLKRSDITTGTDRASVINGTKLALAFTIFKLADKTHTPMKDMYVDVWHCDAAGVYSDENNPMNHEDTASQKWLRGYQVTDEDGVAKFTTIIPGWYDGRTPHIHFKVRRIADNKVTAEFTSQLFFHPKELAPVYANKPYGTHGQLESANQNDGIYSEQLSDGTTAGSHLLIDLKKNDGAAGYSSEISIFVTDDGMRPGRRRGPGGPGGPGGPPPGGPGGPGGRPPGPPPGDFDGPRPR